MTNTEIRGWEVWGDKQKQSGVGSRVNREEIWRCVLWAFWHLSYSILTLGQTVNSVQHDRWGTSYVTKGLFSSLLMKDCEKICLMSPTLTWHAVVVVPGLADVQVDGGGAELGRCDLLEIPWATENRGWDDPQLGVGTVHWPLLRTHAALITPHCNAGLWLVTRAYTVLWLADSGYCWSHLGSVSATCKQQDVMRNRVEIISWITLNSASLQ